MVNTLGMSVRVCVPWYYSRDNQNNNNDDDDDDDDNNNNRYIDKFRQEVNRVKDPSECKPVKWFGHA